MPEVYSNTPAIRPLGNAFRFKPKGVFWMRPVGSEFIERGGDYQEFKLTTTIEENEVYDNQYPEKTLALVDLTKADITVSFQSRMMVEFLRRTAVLSSVLTYSQQAAIDVSITKTIPTGKGIRLAHRDISDIEIMSTGVGAEIYVAGVHYDLDGASGQLFILAHPDGVVLDADGNAEVDITYSAPAIEGRKSYGPMSQTDIRCAIGFRQKMKWGPQIDAVFHDVQLRPDGDIMLGSDGDDFGTMGFTGRVFADPTKPAGFQLGELVDIERAA